MHQHDAKHEKRQCIVRCIVGYGLPMCVVAPVVLTVVAPPRRSANILIMLMAYIVGTTVMGLPTCAYRLHRLWEREAKAAMQDALVGKAPGEARHSGTWSNDA